MNRPPTFRRPPSTASSGPSSGALLLLFALVALLALAPATGAAQAQDDPEATVAENSRDDDASEDTVEAIFQVRHADPEDLADVLRIFRLAVRPNRDLGVLSVRGPRSAVEAARAAVRELDVAPTVDRSIEVVGWILAASRTEELTLGAPMPEEVAPVGRQLGTLFDYRSVRLLDSFTLRTQDGGSGRVSGELPALAQAEFSFGFNSLRLTNGETVRVSYEGVQFTALLPDPAHPDRPRQRTELLTDLDVEADQTAVVGSSAAPGAGNQIVLVLETRLVE